MSHPPRLYSAVEAARLLGIHPVTLRKRAAARQVPHLKLEGRLKFTDEHIAQILRDAERPVVKGA